MTNQNRDIIFGLTIIILSLLQHPIETIGRRFFIRVIPERKFPIGSDQREQKAKMLGERVFKITMNIICVVSLYSIMLGDDCNFLDVRVGGKT
jgi:hypothetical protein